MAFYPVPFTRCVNYYETDRMGVVHHSNYLRFLEEARFFWFDQIGFPYPEIEKRGIIVPAVSAQEQFQAFLRYGDTFSVWLRLAQYNGLRMHFDYEIRNTENRICYQAQTQHCFTRDGDYLPISIRHKFPELHERLLELCAQGTDTV